MDDPKSIWQLRREASGHYLAKAWNSRFTTYLLSAQTNEGLAEAARNLGYSDTPEIASWEAMLREGALCIELVLKAVIAERIRRKQSSVAKVPMSHALDRLWADAALEPLERADQLRLLKLKQILFWSGRYGAPRKDEDVGREQEEMDKLRDVEAIGTLGSMKIYRDLSLEFEDIDRIFMRAFKAYPFD